MPASSDNDGTTVRIDGRELRAVRGDITRLAVDAIVNAANSALAPGAGVDGAIRAAGGPEITRETQKIGGCPVGQAVVTSAGNLPARFVIHAVAPVWAGGRRGELDMLASAYRSSLDRADEMGVRTIGFPSLGTGIYGNPIDRASRVAVKSVAEHLRGESSLGLVVFVLFSESDLRVYATALRELVLE